MKLSLSRLSLSLSLLLALTGSLTGSLAGCGGTEEAPPDPEPEPGNTQTVVEVEQVHETEQIHEREPPPASGPARSVSFPAVARTTMRNGLEINTVQAGNLPVVYLRLVIKSGSANDPERLPGLAQMVANMLKEGTHRRSSAQIAEAVEYLGAHLSVDNDEETLSIHISAMREHLSQAMDILAEIAMYPLFSQDELEKLQRREASRLQLSQSDPSYLARRTFYSAIYGEHPYANIDTTEAAIGAVTVRDLRAFHTTHFAPNNAFLVATGAVTPAEIRQAAEGAFRRWRRRPRIPEPSYTDPPSRNQREVIVVDRPGSQQSMIMVGNLALRRSDADYVPLRVANQILGGSASSRLFMDLRERRSLTYGAYSAVDAGTQIGPFIARAAVPNAVTEQAVSGFFEHLVRITHEQAPADETADARRYLADSFPLSIETPGRIGWLVSLTRTWDFPDNYWDTYRDGIRATSPEQAFSAAQSYIHPEHALVVAVGRASLIVEPLRRYGPVRVIDAAGAEVATFEAAPAEERPASEAPQGE